MADPGIQVDGMAFFSEEASDQLIWVATIPLGSKVATTLLGCHLENFELIFELSTEALLHNLLQALWLYQDWRGWFVFRLIILGRKALSARRGTLGTIEVVIHIRLVIFLLVVINFAKIIVDALLLSVLVHN